MVYYLTPHDRRKRTARWIGLAALFLIGVVVCHALDQVLWEWLKASRVIEERDWYKMLRIAGYLPTWLLAAAIVVTATAGGRPQVARGAVALAASAALAGLLAEILKLIVARERPGLDGLHRYRGIFSGFADGSNLGMPSSHAAVAFGAAFAASRAFPATRWVIIPLAAGCGLTRLLAGAHFTSDVYIAAWLGLATAAICVPGGWRPRRHPGTTRLSA